MDDNSIISIKSILKLMIEKLWLIILLFIIGGTGAFAVSKYIMPLKYCSYTTMYIKNNDGKYQDSSLSAGDLNTAKSLLNTYIAVLQSDSMMRKVSEVLIKRYGEERISEIFSVSQGKISESSLKNCLTMSAVDNTEVMKISAVTKDAEVSRYVCLTIARLAPDFLKEKVGAGSVKIIDEAKINCNPISPNIFKNTLLGTFTGTILAVVIILLIDFFNNTVRISANLSEKFKKPILGEIDDIDKLKKNPENSYLITDKNIPFYVKETYKALRTNLIFSLSTSDKKIIAVSSSAPSEGKSTFSSNISIALSQLDNKILLIDADMRKPVQHMIFGIKNKLGLSSLLGKMNKTDECIQKSVFDNLDIITSGPQPPNPAELLSSKQMEIILKELSEKYDYIIIDMPPVNVVSDPLSIGRFISGLVIVVKYASTTFNDVSEVMKKSILANTKIFGFVMTRVKRKEIRRSYYIKKYDYGYDCIHSESKESDKND